VRRLAASIEILYNLQNFLSKKFCMARS